MRMRAKFSSFTLEFMQTGRASKTALRVGIRRAAHQLIDAPRVLDDPIAVKLLGAGFARDMERAMHKVARDFRLFMAVRSRYVEDRLAEGVAAGASQYVVLGAGLDTFAYRNPFPGLHVFEVDHPATQEWKREMLREAGIGLPPNLTFVSLDFEHMVLGAGLAEEGFDCGASAFFGWLGVTPYLTLDAFRSTLSVVAKLPAGTGIGFDYARDPKTLGAKGKVAFAALAGRVAAAGEPFQLFFTPETMASELERAGFTRFEQVDSDELNERYFKDRADGLKLSAVKLGMVVTAWV
jgi:methyltransferase (TIGR00027 family)